MREGIGDNQVFRINDMDEPQLNRSQCEKGRSQCENSRSQYDNMTSQALPSIGYTQAEVSMSELGRAELQESVTDICRQSPEGADLLVSSFVQSLRSYRRPTVCAPFPSRFCHKGSDPPEKDFHMAEDCVAHFPRIQAIAAAGRARQAQVQVLNPLEELPPRVLHLLHWIVTCKRRLRLVEDPASEIAHMLPPGTSPWGLTNEARSHLASGMAVSHVRQHDLLPHVVLEVSPPDRVQPFDIAKAQKGSFIAYHGTSAENLHSIIRCGLQNMSGTPLQRSGAKFGEGVYLCVDPTVALHYCSAGEGWERSCFGPRARYLLVCEVANGVGVLQRENGLSQQREEGDDGNGKLPPMYIVARNGDMVRLRYLFVYSEPSRYVSEQRAVEGSAQVRGRFGGGGRHRERGLAGGNGPGGMSGMVFQRGESHSKEALDAEASGQHVMQIPLAVPRIDWCKIIIIAYVALLLALGLWNRSSRQSGFTHFFYRLMS